MTLRIHTTFALAIGTVLVLGAAPAHAICDPAAANGVSAVCSGATVDQNAPNGYGSGVETNVTVEVLSGASVTGSSVGINLGQNATVNNHGTVTGGLGDGIFVTGGGGTVQNFGTVTGVNAIIGQGGNNTLINFGTLTSTVDDGIEAGGSGNTLTNHGIIDVFSDGMIGAGGSANDTYINHGEITAGDNGIETGGPGGDTVVNTGTILATNAGIDFFDGAGGTFTNSGTVTGGLAINGAGGTNGVQIVRLQSGSVLTGTGGTAVDLHNGDDEFYYAGTVTGRVDGGVGTDTFGLSGDTLPATLDIGLVSGDAVCDGGEQFCAFETFLKEGASTWELTGTNTEIADFAVNGGLLTVNATMATTDFNVAVGATLGGTGVLGNVVISGTGAPGNSIGTMNVADLTFEPGSLYEVEVAADGTSDLYEVSGTTTINGGDITVFAQPPGAINYVDGQTYLVINSPGGLSGTFDGIIESYAFLDFADSYPGTQVVLTLDILPFSSAAATPNQLATAGALEDFPDTLGTDANAIRNALLFLTTPEAQAAFDQISGEVHASAQESLFQASGLFSSMLMHRARLAPDRPETPVGAAIWMAPMGHFSEYDGDGNAASFDTTSYGVVGGIDVASEWSGGTLLAGLAAGHLDTSTDVDPRSSTADQHSWHLGFYGAVENGPLLLTGAASYGSHGFDTERMIAFPGISRTAEAEYDGNSAAIELEAAWRIPVASSPALKATIAPLVSFAYQHGTHDDAVETGADALDLALASESIDRTVAALGVALTGAAMLGDHVVKFETRVTWEHRLGDDAATQTLALAGAPGSPYTVAGPVVGPDQLAIGLGVGVEFGAAIVGLRYDGAFFGDVTANQGSVVLGMRF